VLDRSNASCQRDCRLPDNEQRVNLSALTSFDQHVASPAEWGMPRL